MPTLLEDALDRVYSAFARWSRPTVVDYCSHCVRPGVVEGLLVPTRLREIPAETLRLYTVYVLSTAGSLADFRYFLPRMLDIAIADWFDGYPDLDVVLGKFVLGDWRGWPAHERQAVAAFLHAWWSTTLARFPADPGPEAVLRSIGDIEDDLGPYLRTWEAALATRAGANHLCDFVYANFGRKGQRYWLHVSGWGDTTVAPVRTWLAGLSGTVAATAETVTDEKTHDVLLELLLSL